MNQGRTIFGPSIRHFVTVFIGLSLPTVAGSAAANEFRTIDGTGNNVAVPTRGSGGQPLIRKAAAAYADGFAAPSGADRPNPRLISLALCQQSEPVPAARATTDFLWGFGVFVNHDMDITEGGEPRDDFPIAIPTGDPYFDPAGTGTQVLPFNRGKIVEGTGTGPENPRQLDNDDTGFLDLSTVYGSDDERALWLRTQSGGKLKTSSHPVGVLLPFNDGTQSNLGQLENFDNSNTNLFLGGDVRANENAVLCAMHTLFLRNHNWWADQFAAQNPAATDEELYQLARRRNVAEFEHIVFYEWLPALLGEGAVPEYTGYNADVDPTCTVEFTTVILRATGHTLLPTTINRLGADGNTIAAGNLRLRDLFFDNAPTVLISAGIDPILRGLASKRCQASDNQFVDDIHHFLFSLPGAGGLDLIALNIQRGRDFGLPDYNTLREAYGLPRKTSFTQITGNRAKARALAAVYPTVDVIDPFIGAVFEPSYRSGSPGELVHVGLVDHFTRVRDGDRFWFENPGVLSETELQEIYDTTLADIIARNTSVTDLQDNVFALRGQTLADRDTNGLLDLFGPALCGPLGLSSFGLMFASLCAVSAGRRTLGLRR